MRVFKPETAMYHIEKFVGEGLTARVFKASRVDSRGHSRQTVALKVLKNRSTIPHLRREFETLARVRSPHCVSVLAWENLPEGSALVLEWIEGVTLGELARFRDVDEQLRIELLSQIQAGLRALENCGLHHGDLSPKNVLVDVDGKVRIVDFGSVPSSEGVIHGTAPYLAPEIWNGLPTSLASDLFALGLIDLDLQSGFRNVPIGIESARQRAFAVATTQNELLSLNCKQRVMKEMLSSSSARGELALRVREILSRRLSQEVLTAQLPISKMRTRFDFGLRISSIGMWLASLLSFAAPVQADAPLLFTEPLDRHVLSIRSHYWTEVWVNGARVGFTPVDVKHLQVGLHRVAWRSAVGTGEIKVQLEKNRTLILADSKARFQLRTGNR